MSVSHKIVNVSVGHNIVLYIVLVMGADRLVLTIVCNGPYWWPVDYRLRNGHGTRSKTTELGLRVFCDLHTFLVWLTDTCKINLNCPYFYLSQLKNIFGFALSVGFYAQKFPFEEKNHLICILQLIWFSVALRSCGRKIVFKSREWEKKIISCTLYCWKWLIIDSCNPTQV